MIYERYDAPALAQDRLALVAADQALQTLAEAARRGDPAADQGLASWLAGSAGWAHRIERDEPQSLFNPARLKGL
jgi:hypothetical protein